MQLLFAFIILSIITLTAVLLIMLSKNSRSRKVQEIAQKKEWEYLEFVNFSETIKAANFGILNYSQNAVFRHLISANDRYYGLGFNFFDCRAVESMGIHNSSIVLFNLKTDPKFSNLHCCITPKEDSANNTATTDSPINKNYLARIRKMQKLIELKHHYAFEQHDLFANDLALLQSFLEACLSKSLPEQTPNLEPKLTPDQASDRPQDQERLNTWLLAHPHLHIEISNGILLAYQPNYLLAEDTILDALDAVAKVSINISNMT